MYLYKKLREVEPERADHAWTVGMTWNGRNYPSEEQQLQERRLRVAEQNNRGCPPYRNGFAPSVLAQRLQPALNQLLLGSRRRRKVVISSLLRRQPRRQQDRVTGMPR